MHLKLENFYLSIVIRYVYTTTTVIDLMFVNKKCYEAVFFIKTNPLILPTKESRDVFYQFKAVDSFWKELKIYPNLQTANILSDFIQHCSNELRRFDQIRIVESLDTDFSRNNWIYSRVIELNVTVKEVPIDISQFHFLKKCRIEMEITEPWKRCFRDENQKLELLRIKSSIESLDMTFISLLLSKYNKFEHCIIQVMGGSISTNEILCKLVQYKRNFYINKERNNTRTFEICCDYWNGNDCIILPYENKWTFWDCSISSFKDVFNQYLPFNPFLFAQKKQQIEFKPEWNINNIIINNPLKFIFSSQFSWCKSELNKTCINQVIEEKFINVCKKTKNGNESKRFQTITSNSKNVLIQNSKINLKDSLLYYLKMEHSIISSFLYLPNLKILEIDYLPTSLDNLNISCLILNDCQDINWNKLSDLSSLRILEIYNFNSNDNLQINKLSELQTLRLDHIVCERIILPSSIKQILMYKVNNHSSIIDLSEIQLKLLRIVHCDSLKLKINYINTFQCYHSVIKTKGELTDKSFGSVQIIQSECCIDILQKKISSIYPIMN
ncbi:hypothetical protein EDI_065530 [Entamoeba dispar SAW760]|uniref:Uncharacterized protein n=1 Tax=Entamoeba dispar (strain ATCC PRA-260 / SAW760) TaxID=370354 RepID=B0EJQ7_ENTDS|nr:uncharacterized protein EDI_065530 [Entamoeba dispar SAW760]EDR25227.1 hypothetical protein EDI_065530 [Entamoeba dispar SAW760]|eukprot:EDR25227.1 hypothetical protein EDI_065530 [Entamoeba dispar SAW760]